MRRVFAFTNRRGAICAVKATSLRYQSTAGVYGRQQYEGARTGANAARTPSSSSSSSSAAAFLQSSEQIKAAIAMPSPSSFALMSACGVAHEVQVGQIGDDNVIQFTLVSHLLDPTEAERSFRSQQEGHQQEQHVSSTAHGAQDGANGSESAVSGSTTSASVNSMTNGSAGNSRSAAAIPTTNAKVVNADNGSKNNNSRRSSRADTAANGGTSSSSANLNEHDPHASAEYDKVYAIAKQQHLHQGAKEQFVVRCFGGDEELLSLQSRLSNGDFVKVEGSFKLNKQKDTSQSSGPSAAMRRSASVANSSSSSSSNSLASQSWANGERSFPYIRVELGDAEMLKQATSMLESAATKKIRLSLKGSHALVKTGNVSMISRTHHGVAK